MVETESHSKSELTTPGPDASAEVWQAYLDAYNPMNLGKPEGKRVNIGLGVKSERWEKLEDNGKHSPTCPINLGTALTGRIDQPNERPVEREVFGEPDDYDD